MKTKLKTPSKSEKTGVKMIRALQKFAGINESHQKALAGWRSMSDSEKESTGRAYEICCCRV